jgi:hypothetical protein
MDTAVLWVKAYLELNGYFTLAEYQVIEALDEGGYRTATDLDIMAVRFPGAGRLVPRSGHPDQQMMTTDPLLDVSEDMVDLIIGEVKEGTAELNRTVRSPEVLKVALARFGAVAMEQCDEVVAELIAKSEAVSNIGFRVRLAAFGTKRPRTRPRFLTINLGHIGQYLQAVARENWETLSTSHFSDPVYGSLMLMEKARRADET